MQISIETTSGLERRMTVGVPAEEIDKEVTQRLQKGFVTIRIFRQAEAGEVIDFKLTGGQYFLHNSLHSYDEIKTKRSFERIILIPCIILFYS